MKPATKKSSLPTASRPDAWATPRVVELSAGAGILDIYGGLRFVAAPLRNLVFHPLQDEMLFIVPDLWVEEPIEWNFIPTFIARIEAFVQEWIRGRNDPAVRESLPIKLYGLRCLEQNKESLDLYSIAET